jgi:hypothetical protein
MMLVLAVRTGPQRVYRRALAYFTEAELAEAFAATRGVASPTQLRAFIKRDSRDLLGEFRALAPPRPPIVLQRWSIRRVALAAAMLGVTAAAVNVGVQAFFPAGNLGVSAPSCGTGHSMILSAQAVPAAAMLPCIAALPSGWSIGGADISSGKVSLWLDSDRAGPAAITVTLTAACDTSGARQFPSDQPGTRRFEYPRSLAPQFSASASTPSPAAASPTGSASRQVRPPCWPPSAARSRSCPGRCSSILSAAPRARPCADEVPGARDEPDGRHQRAAASYHAPANPLSSPRPPLFVQAIQAPSSLTPASSLNYPRTDRSLKCQISGLWRQTCTNRPAATTSLSLFHARVAGFQTRLVSRWQPTRRHGAGSPVLSARTRPTRSSALSPSTRRPARGRGRRPGRSIRRARAPGPSIRPARRRSPPARGGSTNAGRLNWSWPAMKVTLTVRRNHRAESSARSRPTR